MLIRELLKEIATTGGTPAAAVDIGVAYNNDTPVIKMVCPKQSRKRRKMVLL